MEYNKSHSITNQPVKKVIYFCESSMKKIAVILLIAVYALATMGFSLKQFYCCGKLSTVSVAFSNDDNKMCHKENSNDDRCCKSKFQYLKVRDNHVTASHINIPVKHFVHLDLYTAALQQPVFTSHKISFCYRSNAPPLHIGIPAYISNCVFLI